MYEFELRRKPENTDKKLTTDLKANYEKQTRSSDVDKFKNRGKQHSD